MRKLHDILLILEKPLGKIVNLLAWFFVIYCLFHEDWQQGTFWLAWLIYSSVNDEEECDCQKEKAP
jgi:hypothetical protein